MASLVDDLARTVTGFRPADAVERDEQEAWAALTGDPGLLWRDSAPAHFTASAIPFDHDGTRVCLVHHPRIGAWVQPGGHFERGDPTVAAAAARELVEETGLVGEIQTRPLRLSRHPAPCGVGDWHLDLQMLALVSYQRPVTGESHRVEWFRIDRLPGDLAPGVAELASAGYRWIMENELPGET